LRTEFPLGDPLHVPAAEHAHLVRGRRTGLEPGLQPLGQDVPDLRAVAARLAGGDCLDAAVSIGVDPTLDEGSASRERLGDGERLASLDRLHDREQKITCLKCVDHLAGAPSIARSPARLSITGKRPAAYRRRAVKKIRPSRNPNRRRTA
jgi:hypothetical protein